MPMKMRKALSGLLLGLGCAAAFVGMIAVILPRVDNAQLKLVLATFEVPSRFALVNAANAGMRFVLQHSWAVLGAGALGALIGGLLIGCLAEPEAETVKKPYQRPPQPAAPQPRPVREAEDNPFAVSSAAGAEIHLDFAPQSQTVASFVTAHKPLLEENRVEEMPARIPGTFASEARAIVSEVGEESPSGARVIMRTPQPIETEGEAVQAPVSAAAPLTGTNGDNADSPVLRPLQPSPRIRSTMGRHRQW